MKREVERLIERKAERCKKVKGDVLQGDYGIAIARQSQREMEVEKC